ncbi:MAG: hypothetical protein H6Q90_976, partial [Deltaproteobacteria bacterium]|nr:hypothetical protein [Deltaproteobacteria bacterium]
MAQYESGVTACLDPDVLDAWAGGSLAAAERAKAMTHIAECAACRRAISALAQLDPTQDGPTQDGVARRAPSRDGLVGSRLGRYEILRVLGRGG